MSGETIARRYYDVPSVHAFNFARKFVKGTEVSVLVFVIDRVQVEFFCLSKLSDVLLDVCISLS